MVVFACNACGESLKKNQVESHYYRQCRNCNVVSCLDCGKDFWGNDYEQHTKCISEAEKYSGKNFVPKPGANKNEIKQLQWVQQVQDAVDKCTANPALKSLLLRIKDQPNIPRKKNKFMNFIANGMNIRDPKLPSQAWDMLMANVESVKQTKQETVQPQNHTNKQESDKDKTIDTVSQNHTNNENKSESSHTADINDAVKPSKREKKEERRKKAHKAEKKDKLNSNDSSENVIENGVTEKVKKKKKRKQTDESDGENSTKKRKREEEQENLEDSAICCDNNVDEETEEPVKKKFKTKFDWNGVVCEVLRSKGPELKIKKLRRKVLAEYLSQGCTEKSEEKLWAKFEKKLKRNPDVKVIGDRVKLKAEP